MLGNYLKIAFRNLWKQKGYSFLNITGLAIGLACAFLIAVWVMDEISYDRFHENSERIYRVMRNVHSGDQIQTEDIVTWNIARVLEEEYPEVEDVAVITMPENLVLNRGEFAAREAGVHADPEFFDLFSWQLIQGEPAGILRDPGSIVISRSLAEKYFGPDWREHAVGNTIRHNIKDVGIFTVRGVFEDIPRYSSLQFDFVLPMSDFIGRNEWLSDWMNSGVRIFVRTREGADREALSEKITDIQNKHIEGFRSDLFLQSYTDQHLHSHFKDGVLAGGRIDYVRMFVIIAFIIVLIACINFMNLATARSMRQAKEVGVRKAVGAGKRSLTGRFMGESLLLVLLAFVLGIGLAMAVLPFFNELAGKELVIADLVGGKTMLLFAGIGLLTALIGGAYPALYLSSFDAVRILRGTFRLSGGSNRLRKGLVVFQFAMSILLIAGTAIVYQQIRYIHLKNLGLDRENVIFMPLEGQMLERFGSVKASLLQQPGIASVTSASENPLEIGSNTHSVSWRGKDPSSQVSMKIISVNFDFLEVMKMKLDEGRDFSPDFGTDSVNYIINQKARSVMGFEDPLGERLDFWGTSGSIVGVVEDFHIASLYSEIEPTIILLRPQWADRLFLRTEPGRTQEALASLEKIHQGFNPGFPFEYQFLDDSFNQMYSSEMIIGKLAGIFTALALLVACLGLFGLAAFMAERRTKEIGIRKVMGASVTGIVALFSRDFLKLVIIGFAIAVPIAWYVMSRWLEDYAYHVEIKAWMFVGAGLLAMIIALLTVSFQSIKAALMNPVKSLRSE